MVVVHTAAFLVVLPSRMVDEQVFVALQELRVLVVNTAAFVVAQPDRLVEALVYDEVVFVVDAQVVPALVGL